MEAHSENRLTVGVVESQPLLVDGLRAALWGSGAYELLEPTRSLEELTSLMVASSPRIVLVDKGYGMSAVVDWLTRMQDHASTGVVVWGKAMTDFDALRLMRAG